MCLLIVFQQCDFDFAGNWHADAVEEYEEEEQDMPLCSTPIYLFITPDCSQTRRILGPSAPSPRNRQPLWSDFRPENWTFYLGLRTTRFYGTQAVGLYRELDQTMIVLFCFCFHLL